MKPSERAQAYADDVLAGRVPACKWVRLAAARFLNDLDKQKTDWPYEYKPDLADRAVNFMEKMPHIKGKWASEKQRLKFENWQCFIECNIFGWVRKGTKLRRFRTVFELIPRKNAKSTKAAARGLYMFCADGETGAEVYSGATTEKQAHEVFKPAWLMVQKTPGLVNRFGIEQAGNMKNPGSMYTVGDMSKFEALIGKPGDGASPSAALIDEYHEHDSDHMVQAMQTGMGAREQPLLCIISTAGSNLGGPCYEMQQDICRILEGNVQDDTVFGIIFGIDEGDDWDDPAILMKANPNYGVSVFPEFLQAQLDQAKRSASQQNAFRTKHLNEWVGAKSAWMNMVAWQRQKKPMTIEQFTGVPCRVAVDFSSRKDVTPVDVTFFKDGQYYSFKKFFAPEAAIEENEKYRDFVSMGCLEPTDGAQVDQGVVEDYIKDIARKFPVLDFTFDEWQAEYMMTRLQALRLEVVKFPFNTRHVSEPMKMLEALVLDGKYWHDGNPMMTWMVGNVAARLDVRDNIFPNKARPHDPRCKIDGVVTSIMSMGRWIVEKAPPPDYKIHFLG